MQQQAAILLPVHARGGGRAPGWVVVRVVFVLGVCGMESPPIYPIPSRPWGRRGLSSMHS